MRTGDGALGNLRNGVTDSRSRIEDVVASWPTPQVHDATGGKTPAQVEAMRAATGAGVRNLNETAENWPTPTTRDWKATGNLDNVPENCLLGRVAPQMAESLASSRPGPRILEAGPPSSKDRRSLNQRFVGWLMGWPPGFTAVALSSSGCSATELSRYKLRMRSALSSLGLPPPGPPVQHSLFG